MITAQTIITVVILYLVIINVVGYVIMGVDKKRAIRGAWRISEASLFFTALLGGSLGCILGMQHFRHKTKHWYFKYGMPAILVVQVLLFALLSHIKMPGSKGLSPHELAHRWVKDLRTRPDMSIKVG